jgi:Flp pilus assembly protein TadD
VQLEPKNAKYLNNLGYALLLRGDSRGAVGVLTDAVRAAPAGARARNNLGLAYARLGDFPRAARQFGLGGTPAEATNNLGFGYEVQGNRAQALEHYREAVRLDPSFQRARENLDRLEQKAPARSEDGEPRPSESGALVRTVRGEAEAKRIAPAGTATPLTSEESGP